MKTKFTACTGCSHLNVCRLRENYSRLVTDMTNFADSIKYSSEDFSLDVHCSQYASVTAAFPRQVTANLTEAAVTLEDPRAAITGQTLRAIDCIAKETAENEHKATYNAEDILKQIVNAFKDGEGTDRSELLLLGKIHAILEENNLLTDSSEDSENTVWG